jgi:hypothetical protein
MSEIAFCDVGHVGDVGDFYIRSIIYCFLFVLF